VPLAVVAGVLGMRRKASDAVVGRIVGLACIPAHMGLAVSEREEVRRFEDPAIGELVSSLCVMAKRREEQAQIPVVHAAAMGTAGSAAGPTWAEAEYLMDAAQVVVDTSAVGPSAACWVGWVLLAEIARKADQAVARIPVVGPRTFVAGFR
jgi:hypothetical protein